MKFAEHPMLNTQAALYSAHSFYPAHCGLRYRYTKILTQNYKTKSLLTKSLCLASIHSCLNNRRTLSQNTWIQPLAELSHPSSPFEILLGYGGNSRLPQHSPTNSSLSSQTHILEKKI